MKTGYVPKVCACCGQTETYLLAIDPGTIDIVKAIAAAVRNKGVNAIHPRKEMEHEPGVPGTVSDSPIYRVRNGRLTSNQVGNLSRPRFHGLIARVRGQAGIYCLTRKGARFLKGSAIPQFAIVSKVEKKQIGYYEPETHRVTIYDFGADEAEYWMRMEYPVGPLED